MKSFIAKEKQTRDSIRKATAQAQQTRIIQNNEYRRSFCIVTSRGVRYAENKRKPVTMHNSNHGEENCMTQLFNSSEETAQHSAAKTACKAAGREGTSCDIRSLAELVAA
jgi:hypothetical protein